MKYFDETSQGCVILVFEQSYNERALRKSNFDFSVMNYFSRFRSKADIFLRKNAVANNTTRVWFFIQNFIKRQFFYEILFTQTS